MSGRTEGDAKFEQAAASLREFFDRVGAGEAVTFDEWCAERTSIAPELRALHATCEEIHSALGTRRPQEASAPAAFLSDILAELARRSGNSADYGIGGVIAQGGMGEVRSVRDKILRRELAMKRLRARTPPEVDPRWLARFVEEAQVTAQLDHPGIVPVHELGLDAAGRVFFTMKLVRGRNLGQVFELVRDGREGWNETRALGVLLKVCEAMAYAHAKGVIHRDLKPANVMVGSFGEVYVMDWGLARVLGEVDRHDLRLDLGTGPGLETERSGERASAPDSPLHTMDGDVVGTPAYMPPEQARGAIEELGPHSDVYSIGAMLYHLLSGAMPYESSSSEVASRTILARVLAGPPAPLHELRRDAPSELVAICSKAMERRPERRYRDTLELAEDLRAYLEHRVVRAHRTGALVELRKWVERNRGLALASAAAATAVLAGLVVSSGLYVRAEKKADDVLRLSAQYDLDRLIAEADGLWPAVPEGMERCLDWLGRAEGLAAELPGYEQRLAELRRRARGPEPPSAGLAAAPGRRWDFDRSEDRWWHDRLQQLVAELTAFSDPERGLLSAGLSPTHGWGVRRRLEFARTLREHSLSGPAAAARWADACASIRDRRECPAYGGLELAPQLGLLPLGRDPDSDLWEFAHLATGVPASRGADGKLLLRPETGLVLVLLPGGTFRMGAQSSDPGGRNHDPQAWRQDTPVHEVSLSPFFLSKYEMTQGQWQRVAGNDPSFLHASGASEDPADGSGTGTLHPVENASWLECAAWTSRLGLSLPTEAQWEYAVRAGTSTAWCTGDDEQTLSGSANLMDLHAEQHEGFGWSVGSERWLDDGSSAHARVGSYRPNAFGLHDVHGNVSEWCRDRHGSYALPVRAGDGERLVPAGEGANRVFRGGSFRHSAEVARSACRSLAGPEFRDFCNGLRPARSLTAP